MQRHSQVAGAFQKPLETVQLLVAAHKNRSRQRLGRGTEGTQFERTGLIAVIADLKANDRFVLHNLPGVHARTARDHDLAGIRSARQSAGQVDDAAENGVLAADPTGRRQIRIDACATLKFNPDPSAVSANGVDCGPSGLQCPQRVVLVGVQSAKDGQHRIALELQDLTLERLDFARQHGQDFAHQVKILVAFQAFGKFRRGHQIDEDHADPAALMGFGSGHGCSALGAEAPA